MKALVEAQLRPLASEQAMRARPFIQRSFNGFSTSSS
jgi:hypothetical protein